MKTHAVEKYKQSLEAKRRRLIDEIQRLGQAANEDVQAPGDISSVPTQPADRDSEGLDSKIALEKTEGHILNQVDAALQRIDNGTFGRCEGCGREIAEERLEALPYTPYCVECEKQQESG